MLLTLVLPVIATVSVFDGKETTIDITNSKESAHGTKALTPNSCPLATDHVCLIISDNGYLPGLQRPALADVQDSSWVWLHRTEITCQNLMAGRERDRNATYTLSVHRQPRP